MHKGQADALPRKMSAKSAKKWESVDLAFARETHVGRCKKHGEEFSVPAKKIDMEGLLFKGSLVGGCNIGAATRTHGEAGNYATIKTLHSSKAQGSPQNRLKFLR